MQGGGEEEDDILGWVRGGGCHDDVGKGFGKVKGESERGSLVFWELGEIGNLNSGGLHNYVPHFHF